MTASLDVRCPNCGTFFRPQALNTPASVFCPRCGKNVATAVEDRPTEQSSGAIVAVVLGGCLIGSLLLVLVVVGAGFLIFARVSKSVAPPPVATVPKEVVPQPARPSTVPSPERATIPDRPGSNDSPFSTPGTSSQSPLAPVEPATTQPPAVREPNPFDQPAPPTKAPPAKTPPSPAPTPPTPPAIATSPPPKPDNGPPVASQNRMRYGWKTGDAFNYTIVVTAKSDDVNRVARGAASFSVRQADPRTSLDGTPLDRADKSSATGSAFFVTADGYLVTCAHVVKGATKVRVRFGDTPLDANIVAIEHEHDLALLKVAVEQAPVLDLGDSEKIELAQEVRAVGYPLSDVLGASVKVTRGTIAGLIDRDERRLLQVDAAINAGNSGGPLVDERARVVGVATSKLAGDDVSNVGFAVPVNVLKQWLTERAISFSARPERERLDGPELARQVTPAVVMLDVELGPGGAGQERQFLLSYTGSLHTQNAAAARPGAVPFGAPPFGPRGFFPGMNTGIDQGQLRVDVAGNVLEFQGKEHLPFLVGPLGLTPFEPLPPEGTKKWRVRRPMMLSLMKSDDENVAGLPRMARPRPPFGPRGPIGPGSPFDPGFPFGPRGAVEEEKPLAVIPALETSDYELSESTDRTYTIKKRSELKTVGKKDAPVTVELVLAGDYTIDRDLGLLVRLNLDGKFTEKKDDVSRSIPLKVSCERTEVRPNGVAQGAAAPAVGGPGAGLPGAAPPQPPAKPTLADEEITKSLVDAINPSADFFVRHQALSRLVNSTPVDARRAEVVGGVMPVIADMNSALSSTAIRIVGAWAGKEQVPTLLKLLDDVQGLSRIHVYQALGECRVADEQLAKKLVARLLVREDRSMALQALKSQGNTAEAPLLEMLQQPGRDSQVNFFLFIALRECGAEKSVEVLKTMLEDKSDPALNGQIGFALSAIEARVAKQNATPKPSP